MPQNFPEHPHEVFRRNIWVSPFWDEGLTEPKGFWKYAEGMDEQRTYDFMGDNARRFMGLPIANPDPSAVNPPALASA